MKPEDVLKAATARAEALLREQRDKPTMRHPRTGALFADAWLEVSAPTQQVRTHPPLPPSRHEVTEWDDEGNELASRELTEEEYAERLAAYTIAREEWHRTRGMRRIQTGPVEICAHFTFADGSSRTADLVGDEWRWTELVDGGRS